MTTFGRGITFHYTLDDVMELKSVQLKLEWGSIREKSNGFARHLLFSTLSGVRGQLLN